MHQLHSGLYFLKISFADGDKLQQIVIE